MAAAGALVAPRRFALSTLLRGPLGLAGRSVLTTKFCRSCPGSVPDRIELLLLKVEKQLFPDNLGHDCRWHHRHDSQVPAGRYVTIAMLRALCGLLGLDFTHFVEDVYRRFHRQEAESLWRRHVDLSVVQARGCVVPQIPLRRMETACG